MSCISLSGQQALRSAMACTLQTAAFSIVMARICNAAGHWTPQMNAAQKLVQLILSPGV